MEEKMRSVKVKQNVDIVYFIEYKEGKEDSHGEVIGKVDLTMLTIEGFKDYKIKQWEKKNWKKEVIK